MSEPLIILTSAKLSIEDFGSFIENAGGRLVPGQEHEGRIYDGERTAWLFFSPETVRDEIEDNSPTLFDLLRGAPQSAIVAEISRNPSGRGVFLKAAASFTSRWPNTVIRDADDHYRVLSDLV